MVQMLEPMTIPNVWMNFLELNVALRSKVVLLLEMSPVSVQLVSVLHTLDRIVLKLGRLSIVVVHLRPETARDDLLDGRHLWETAVVIDRRAQVRLVQ